MPQETKQDNTSEMSVVVFTLDNEEYAAPVEDVLEVIKAPQLIPLPNSPEHVLGFINLRGKVVSVVDIEKKFDLVRQGERSQESEVLIVDSEDEAIGVLVDDVLEVLSVPVDSIQEPPASVLGKLGVEHLRGVVLVDADTAREDAARVETAAGAEEPNAEEGDGSITSLAGDPEKRALLVVNLKDILKSGS